MERVSMHLRDIRLEKEKPINFHFVVQCHTTIVTERTECQLRERTWVKKWASVRPNEDVYISSISVLFAATLPMTSRHST